MTTKETFRVGGMTCGGCVATVKRVVGMVPGVRGVDVSLQAGSAEVEYDPAKTQPQAIVAAITGAGFEAQLPSR
jgi:copper chaperone